MKQTLSDPRSNSYEELSWTLQKDWKQFQSYLVQCCESPKTGAVHGLRISIRKLISLLDLLQNLRSWKEIKKLKKSLKNNLTILGDLRDLQNQEKAIYEPKKPSILLKFKTSIKEKKKHEQKVIKKKLNNIDLKTQNTFIQNLTEDLVKESKNLFTAKRIQKKFKNTLTRRYEEFEKNALKTSPISKITLHKTRIKFKKFRYTWEALERLCPKDKRTEEELKSLQKLLGEIQDAAILTQCLVEFLVNNKEIHPDSEFLQFLHSVENKYEESISRFFLIRNQSLHEIHRQFEHAQKKIA